MCFIYLHRSFYKYASKKFCLTMAQISIKCCYYTIRGVFINRKVYFNYGRCQKLNPFIHIPSLKKCFKTRQSKNAKQISNISENHHSKTRLSYFALIFFIELELTLRSYQMEIFYKDYNKHTVKPIRMDSATKKGHIK